MRAAVVVVMSRPIMDGVIFHYLGLETIITDTPNLYTLKLFPPIKIAYHLR